MEIRHLVAMFVALVAGVAGAADAGMKPFVLAQRASGEPAAVVADVKALLDQHYQGFSDLVIDCVVESPKTSIGICRSLSPAAKESVPLFAAKSAAPAVAYCCSIQR